jgi:hypothetical protein
MIIHQFKQLNELTEGQKSIKENDNQNSMFDIVIRQCTRPQERHRAWGYKYATPNDKTVLQNIGKRKQLYITMV